MLVDCAGAVMSVLGASCTTTFMPTDTGGDIGNGGTGGTVSFSVEIQPIFTTACAGCHSPGGNADSARIPSHLTDGEAYDLIVGVPSVQRSDLILVVPGDSAASLLYLKVSSISPPTGNRMPLFAPVLSDAEIGLIRDWINQGAENN